MKATIHNIQQGSDLWLRLRSQYNTASEAPAALGESKYQTRSALLKQKSTGLTDDVDGAKQALFDRGHAAEEAARAIAEDILGEDLFPITATLTVDGVPLLASLDGATYDGTTIWEHKLYSASLAEDVESGKLDPHYTTQLDQQLLVTGAKKCLFMTSDGTTEKLSFCWYYADQTKFDALVAGWHQFAADLAAYVPTEVVAEAVGRTPETLPALHIVMRGEISESNLAEFKQVALTAIRSVNRDLKTDQDFADSAKARKWCEDIESRVAAAKDHALGQTKTIDDLFRTMDEISNEARDVRLALEKLEKARKVTRRDEIVAEGIKEFSNHMSALNLRLGKHYMPHTPCDFGGAIKGLRTFDSMQNAVDTTLANAKISASATADKIDTNLRHLSDVNAPMGLFSDMATICMKEKEDFVMLVKFRIDSEAVRIEELAETAREKIRKEEADKLIAKADAEKKAQDAITAAQAIPVPEPLPNVLKMAARIIGVPMDPAVQVKPGYIGSVTRVTPPTLTLGMMSNRLGFQLTAAFIASLGFEPAARVKASVLYHEHQFNDICQALIDHISSVCALQAA